MKSERIASWRGKTRKELETELRATQENIWKLRGAVASRESKRVRDIRMMRKKVAQILTVLREQAS